jgi:hypothetical protein
MDRRMMMSEWIKEIPENPQFEWIKTSKKMPCPHQLILFMDGHESKTIHYGVFCSELSPKGHKNKFWCHIFKKTYNKKEILLWSYIPEKEAFKILYPKFKIEFNKLHENFLEKILLIEQSILKDIENDDCLSKPYSNPSVIVRNTISRMCDQVFMLNID